MQGWGPGASRIVDGNRVQWQEGMTTPFEVKKPEFSGVTSSSGESEGDLLWQKKREEGMKAGQWSMPMFSRDNGGAVTPETEEEKRRRLLGESMGTPPQPVPPPAEISLPKINPEESFYQYTKPEGSKEFSITDRLEAIPSELMGTVKVRKWEDVGQGIFGGWSGKTYYEAHPEEKFMDAVTEANRPLMDMYQKLIEENKSRSQGFGMMGMGGKEARIAREQATRNIVELTKGMGELMGKTEETRQKYFKEFRKEPKIPTPHYVPTIEKGMFGKFDISSGTFTPIRKATKKDIEEVETGKPEKPEGDKTGQNWMLPNGSSAISYDGGRTYVTPDGQTRPMPSTAVKVPGGATLSEIKMEKAKQQAQLDIGSAQEPPGPSPKEAALGGTGPYGRVASVFEAVAGGFGLDILVGEKEGFFPNLADAKQFLRSVKQMGKAALMNSSRGAIWEQQKIDQLFPDPDKTFTNPRIEARKFGNLQEILAIEKKFNNQAIVDALTPQEIGKYRNANNEIDRLISFISEPRGGGLTAKEKALVDKYLKKQ